MKYNLIKTDNYLLVVDDSEIKEGDWFFRDGSIHKCFRVHRTDIEFLTSIDSIYCGSNTFWSKEYCKKIMAHAPLNNSPILEGVPLLPPLEDDVEKLDEEHSPYPKPYKTYEKGFDKGYNKAREKYKFTEEDIRQAYLFGKSMMSPKNFEKYLQSLQQSKLPIAFECEIERVFKHNEHMEREFYEVPKTITNSEGRTEWVGKYIYE
jgi:hypothetical protein